MSPENFAGKTKLCAYAMRKQASVDRDSGRQRLRRTLSRMSGRVSDDPEQMARVTLPAPSPGPGLPPGPRPRSKAIDIPGKAELQHSHHWSDRIFLPCDFQALLAEAPAVVRSGLSPSALARPSAATATAAATRSVSEEMSVSNGLADAQ